MKVPTNLNAFVTEQKWTFAKTNAHTWPHEYIVRDRADQDLFIHLVRHIRTYGYKGNFYSKHITYYDEDGVTYWTMGAPIEETIVVNRCKNEQTYDYRQKQGTLPESKNANAEQGTVSVHCK